mgnify:CR=1 FL=1
MTAGGVSEPVLQPGLRRKTDLAGPVTGRVQQVGGYDKGVEQAFVTLVSPFPELHRVHRPLGHSEIPPLQSSRNLGPNRGETAPKPLICIGVGTEASNRIGFVRCVGPTASS